MNDQQFDDFLLKIEALKLDALVTRQSRDDLLAQASPAVVEILKALEKENFKDFFEQIQIKYEDPNVKKYGALKLPAIRKLIWLLLATDAGDKFLSKKVDNASLLDFLNWLPQEIWCYSPAEENLVELTLFRCVFDGNLAPCDLSSEHVKKLEKIFKSFALFNFSGEEVKSLQEIFLNHPESESLKQEHLDLFQKIQEIQLDQASYKQLEFAHDETVLVKYFLYAAQQEPLSKKLVFPDHMQSLRQNYPGLLEKIQCIISNSSRYQEVTFACSEALFVEDFLNVKKQSGLSVQSIFGINPGRQLLSKLTAEQFRQLFIAKNELEIVRRLAEQMQSMSEGFFHMDVNGQNRGLLFLYSLLMDPSKVVLLSQLTTTQLGEFFVKKISPDIWGLDSIREGEILLWSLLAWSSSQDLLSKLAWPVGGRNYFYEFVMQIPIWTWIPREEGKDIPLAFLLFERHARALLEKFTQAQWHQFIAYIPPKDWGRDVSALGGSYVGKTLLSCLLDTSSHPVLLGKFCQVDGENDFYEFVMRIPIRTWIPREEGKDIPLEFLLSDSHTRGLLEKFTQAQWHQFIDYISLDDPDCGISVLGPSNVAKRLLLLLLDTSRPILLIKFSMDKFCKFIDNVTHTIWYQQMGWGSYQRYENLIQEARGIVKNAHSSSYCAGPGRVLDNNVLLYIPLPQYQRSVLKSEAHQPAALQSSQLAVSQAADQPTKSKTKVLPEYEAVGHNSVTKCKPAASQAAAQKQSSPSGRAPNVGAATAASVGQSPCDMWPGLQQSAAQPSYNPAAPVYVSPPQRDASGLAMNPANMWQQPPRLNFDLAPNPFAPAPPFFRGRGRGGY